MLLQNGADVNARDGFFYTPLHLSCVNGAVACVDVLLRAGADPTCKAQGGVTPLLAARKPEIRGLLKTVLPVWSNGRVLGVGGGGGAGGRGDGDRSVGGGDGGGSQARGRGGGGGDGRASAVEGGGISTDSSDEAVTVSFGEGRQAGNAAATDTVTAAAAPAANGAGSKPMMETNSNTTPRGGAVRVRNLPVDVCVGSPADAADAGAEDAAVAMDVDDDYDSEPSLHHRHGAAVMPAAAGTNAAVRAGCGQPIPRGRPVSRLPAQDFVVRRRRRLRRSSTGSVLKKVFSGPLDLASGINTLDETAPAPGAVVVAPAPAPCVSHTSAVAGAGAAASAAVNAAAAPAQAVVVRAPQLVIPSPSRPRAKVVLKGGPSAFLAAISDDVATPPLSVVESRPGIVAVPSAAHHPPERLLHTAPRIRAPQVGAPASAITEDARSRLADAIPVVVLASASSSARSDGRSSPASEPARPFRGNDFKLTVNIPDVSGGIGSPRSDVSAKAGPAAAAIMIPAITAAPATTTTSTRATSHTTTAYKKKRRAKSLPPYWESNGQSARRRLGGQQPRPPRRVPLESRPCMDGPTAVIKTLALDDTSGDDGALSCWLQGTWAEGAGSGGAGGDSSMPSSPVVPLRRATTLVG